MINKTFLPFLLMIILVISLVGCSTPTTIIPATDTPTSIPPTPTVPPSASPVPATETSTPVPPTPTSTMAPVNTIQHFPAEQEFTVASINMIDAQVGWATGGLSGVGDHVLKTFDGGSTWMDLTPPEEVAPSDDQITATAYFQDAQTGWVIYSLTSGITPAQSVIWRTQDGGLSWQASQPLDLSNLTEFYYPDYLQFSDSQNGWVMVHVGAGMNHDYYALFHSQDGGVSWSRIQDPYNDTSGTMSCSKTDLLFTDATHGWLTGDCHGVAAGVQLFKSNDAGLTWETVTLPDPAGSPGLLSTFDAACGAYDLFFFGNDSGHLGVRCAYYDQDPMTYKYFLYTTQDGGSTWTSSTYPGETLYFFSANTGWAFSSKVQITSDGGLTWKAVSNVSWTVKSDYTQSAAVDFVSETIGWGIARGTEQPVLPALVLTINAGARWAMLVPVVGP
jgi:photosystem II stability/assembly factor-like uncharacterized protein